MKLRDALKNGLISLTDLEKRCLQRIRSQGSFYEEGLGSGEFKPGTFFGWEIFEYEVKGCRGAISSLSKKGVLTVVDDDSYFDVISAYYINYELEFDKNDRILFE